MTQGTFTFRGRNVAEAMKKVVAELGTDALIMERRQVRPNGKNGLLSGLLGGEEMVEIIAMPPQEKVEKRSVEPKSLLAKVYANAPARPSFAPPRETPASPLSVSPHDTLDVGGARSAADLLPKIESKMDVLRDELREEMRRLLFTQARGGLPAVGDTLLQEYQHLLENDVAADVARDLIERMQRAMGGRSVPLEQIRHALCEAITRMIPTSGPIHLVEGRPTVVALVGPTGVGKTTTIAKLAVEFAYKRNKKIGLINEDVCRPGALEQLRNLSQLLTLPLVAAEDGASARNGLKQMQDCDLVLVDTAGRVPKNAPSIEALAAYLQALEPDETHLVLSGDCSDKVAAAVVEGFRPTGYDRMMISKADEAVNYGLILNVAGRVAAGVSYVTTGQEFAEHIVPGESPHLARLVLGMETCDNIRAQVAPSAGEAGRG